MRNLPCIILLVAAAVSGWAGGKKEESSIGRSEYLTSRGNITPAEEIDESSFIGAVDYSYPQPEDPFGVTAYIGNRQVSASGQEAVIVIGLQGRRAAFSELPPMNLAFVIDKSGSMSDRHKMEWVKESFDIFIDHVRSEDFVSLVVFDGSARVVFPSTLVAGNREQFRAKVRSIRPGGGTNLTAGLKLGYEQVMANYRREYNNRVLFLTDGMNTSGDSSNILDMAETYQGLGIRLSTIGLGHEADLNMMRNLAERGGGSSRFISGRERMQEAFGQGLSRMVVPAARDISVDVELLGGVRLMETWFYDHSVRGNTVVYPLSVIHLGDYETIILKMAIPQQKETGSVPVLRIRTSFMDDERNRRELEPITVNVEAVDRESPVDGYSDAVVLRAGTVLNFARVLKEIGRRYYRDQQLFGAQRQELLRSLLDMANRLKKEILNARERLEYDGFRKELKIVENTMKSLGKELEMGDGELEGVWRDRELEPVVQERNLLERIDALFREMSLDLQNRKPGNIALTGFAISNPVGNGREHGITDFLNELAHTAFSKQFTIVERTRIDQVLQEQQLSLSDMMETTDAIRIGKSLAANYIVTGTVIRMHSSLVIFSRIIDTSTTAVESAAQIIVPIDDEVRSLL